jgi:hypothetical protein
LRIVEKLQDRGYLTDFSLWRDLRFVYGVMTGVGIGGLIAYSLAWDRTLGMRPAWLALPFLLLMAVGQILASRATRLSRQTDEGKPQKV